MPTKPTTVPAYVASLPSDKRQEFEVLRKWVRGVLPRATETMGYKVPTYEGREKICAISAQKRYFALYLCDTDALDRHRAAFEHLNVGKGFIRFAHMKDLPRGAARRMLLEATRELA